MSQDRESWYEEFKVQGDELLSKVREIIADGNARRIFIKNEDGETIFEIPLTAGVAITAAGALLAPVLVGIGAVAALVTKVTIGVERSREDAAGDGSETGDPDPDPAQDPEAQADPGADPAPEAE